MLTAAKKTYGEAHSMCTRLWKRQPGMDSLMRLSTNSRNKTFQRQHISVHWNRFCKMMVYATIMMVTRLTRHTASMSVVRTVHATAISIGIKDCQMASIVEPLIQIVSRRCRANISSQMVATLLRENAALLHLLQWVARSG